jgi:hypothetical protein
VLAAFPGAEIVDVRKGEAVISEQSVPGDCSEETLEPPPDESALGSRSARIVLPGHDDV